MARLYGTSAGKRGRSADPYWGQARATDGSCTQKIAEVDSGGKCSLLPSLLLESLYIHMYKGISKDIIRRYESR